MKILVINCGSSSLKFQLIDMDNGVVLAKGLCDRIGAEGSTISYTARGFQFTITAIYATHLYAFEHLIRLLSTGETRVIDSIAEIGALGHRVTHGGEHFREPTLVDDSVIEALREISSLAPLHNPAAIQGLISAKKIFGEHIPNIAVFDTSFHSTMPQKVYMYAIPYEYYTDLGVRRYGFHGTSHKFVSYTAARFVEKPLSDLRVITCHLGNGGSVAAVDHGKVLDTSMGMTPLAGLMMGTRCGDLDASVVNYVKYQLGITGYDMNDILNKKSGLLGISGLSSDKRDLNKAYTEGNERAILAVDMFNYIIRKTIGAYMMAMGGVDIVVFTGGIGENDASTREAVCADLEWFNMGVDHDLNWGASATGKEVVDISAPNTRVKVLVVKTNEELMIAKETLVLVNQLQADARANETSAAASADAAACDAPAANADTAANTADADADTSANTDAAANTDAPATGE